MCSIEKLRKMRSYLSQPAESNFEALLLDIIVFVDCSLELNWKSIDLVLWLKIMIPSQII